MALVKKRILLVDDDPKSCYILSVTLRLNNYHVAPYVDVEQALSEFQKDSYDLLMTNVSMAKMSGFELFHKVRTIDANVKVCFMVNHNNIPDHSSEFRELFPDLPITGLADKPVTAEEVVRLVKEHLEN